MLDVLCGLCAESIINSNNKNKRLRGGCIQCALSRLDPQWPTRNDHCVEGRRTTMTLCGKWNEKYLLPLNAGIVEWDNGGIVGNNALFYSAIFFEGKSSK